MFSRLELAMTLMLIVLSKKLEKVESKFEETTRYKKLNKKSSYSSKKSNQ